MPMTEEQRVAFIDSFWIKLNSVGYVCQDAAGLDDNFELNTFTKQIRDLNSDKVYNTNKKGKIVLTNKNGVNFNISVVKLLKALKILGY